MSKSGELYNIVLTDCQLLVSWETDSCNTEVLDLTTIPYTGYVSLQSSELSLFKFWERTFSDVLILCLSVIQSGFLFMWSAQSSILTAVTIILDYYFEANPGVKNLPWPGIEPQSPSPQSVVIAMSYDDPREDNLKWPTQLRRESMLLNYSLMEWYPFLRTGDRHLGLPSQEI